MRRLKTENNVRKMAKVQKGKRLLMVGRICGMSTVDYIKR